ncbi:MAG TPA: glycerol kinase GlpK [Deinococcales bacterium]|nr:glycerol kinase GlpK [Deinococcales bacterium]
MDVIVALDQGTTSSRAIAFDRAGRVQGVAQRELKQHLPQPGWVEHDPLEIWHSQAAVMNEAVERCRGQVIALGITNQRETTVLWDRHTGEPLSRAIVWQDRRTAPMCERLRADGLEPLFRDRTGLLLDPYFSGTKLAWLLDNLPGARERAEAGDLAFGTVDSWLVWRLSGGKRHVTDVTNAARTLMFDIHRSEWDEDLLAALNIPRAVLPEVVPSGGVAAETTDGVPIAGIAGDQHAALFGQACLRPGMAKNTYGTGCFMLLNTGGTAVSSRNGLLTTPAWAREGSVTYALEGSVFIAGAAVQWLRDGLGFIRNAADVEELAMNAPDTGGVYLVPAFVGLGAPYWDPEARGAIVGITRGTSRAHIARAALEAIAFQSRDLLDAMSGDAAVPISELRVDGGAARNDLLMQFQADVLGVPVVRPTITETTALGAAYLAGLAVGFWSGTGEIERNWLPERRFEPRMSESERQDRYGGWLDAVARTRSNSVSA